MVSFCSFPSGHLINSPMLVYKVVDDFQLDYCMQNSNNSLICPKKSSSSFQEKNCII